MKLKASIPNLFQTIKKNYNFQMPRVLYTVDSFSRINTCKHPHILKTSSEKLLQISIQISKLLPVTWNSIFFSYFRWEMSGTTDVFLWNFTALPFSILVYFKTISIVNSFKKKLNLKEWLKIKYHVSVYWLHKSSQWEWSFVVDKVHYNNWIFNICVQLVSLIFF